MPSHYGKMNGDKKAKKPMAKKPASRKPASKKGSNAMKEKMAKQYIGGIGLGIRLLMDNSKPGTDPFSPDNPLIFATGPLSGTMGPTAGNGYAVVSKSPATGGVAESKAHGFFGPELKRAGYDAVPTADDGARPAELPTWPGR